MLAQEWADEFGCLTDFNGRGKVRSHPGYRGRREQQSLSEAALRVRHQAAPASRLSKPSSYGIPGHDDVITLQIW